MKPLFTGFFCPNDCDRKPAPSDKPIRFRSGLGDWWEARIYRTAFPPGTDWYGWWCYPDDLEDTIERLLRREFPGWPADQAGYLGPETFNSGSMILVASRRVLDPSP